MTTTPQTEPISDFMERHFAHLRHGRKEYTEAEVRSIMLAFEAGLSHLVAENSDLRERNAALGNAQEIALDTATEHALRADELRGALATAEAERDQLARWKSTNAPRLEALDGLLADARAEAAKGAEAISSLASEREANAILTAENDQLRAQVERLQGGEPVTLTDFDAIDDDVIDAAQESSGMYRVELMRAWNAIIAALREKGELR